MTSYDRDTPRDIQRLGVQLTLMALALFLMLGLQTVVLILDRASLMNLGTQQDPTVQQSLKVRQQLDSVARGIARLAEEGDVNAKAIIDDLRRQGITVNNPQASAQQ